MKFTNLSKATKLWSLRRRVKKLPVQNYLRHPLLKKTKTSNKTHPQLQHQLRINIRRKILPKEAKYSIRKKGSNNKYIRLKVSLRSKSNNKKERYHHNAFMKAQRRNRCRVTILFKQIMMSIMQTKNMTYMILIEKIQMIF